jgi:hypothetical protein
MKPEINPEPSPEDREALEEALRRLLGLPANPRSAWWRSGVEENVGDAEPEG